MGINIPFTASLPFNLSFSLLLFLFFCPFSFSVLLLFSFGSRRLQEVYAILKEEQGEMIRFILPWAALYYRDTYDTQ